MSFQPDLETIRNIFFLMESSKNIEEWVSNCELIKKAYHDMYPPFWYDLIGKSGLAKLKFKSFRSE